MNMQLLATRQQQFSSWCVQVLSQFLFKTKSGSIRNSWLWGKMFTVQKLLKCRKLQLFYPDGFLRVWLFSWLFLTVNWFVSIIPRRSECSAMTQGYGLKYSVLWTKCRGSAELSLCCHLSQYHWKTTALFYLLTLRFPSRSCCNHGGCVWRIQCTD